MLFGLEGSDERKRERLLSDFEVDESDSKEEKGGEMRFMFCWAGGGGGSFGVCGQSAEECLAGVRRIVG